MGVTAHFTGSLQIGVDMMEPHVDRSRMEQGYNGIPFPLYPIVSWLTTPFLYQGDGYPPLFFMVKPWKTPLPGGAMPPGML